MCRNKILSLIRKKKKLKGITIQKNHGHPVRKKVSSQDEQSPTLEIVIDS